MCAVKVSTTHAASSTCSPYWTMAIVLEQFISYFCKANTRNKKTIKPLSLSLSFSVSPPPLSLSLSKRRKLYFGRWQTGFQWRISAQRKIISSPARLPDFACRLVIILNPTVTGTKGLSYLRHPDFNITQQERLLHVMRARSTNSAWDLLSLFDINSDSARYHACKLQRFTSSSSLSLSSQQ